jgi:hypothetical protein
MQIKTAFDVYDYYVLSELKKKHGSFQANWTFAPPELAFRFAKTEFGENIFPLINIFYSEDPKLVSDMSNVANFYLDLDASMTDELVHFNGMTVRISFQVDLFTNNKEEANLFFQDYFKFHAKNFMEFKMDDLGIPESTKKYEVIFEELADNSNLDQMFEQTMYFRHSYVFHLNVLMMDVKTPFELESIDVTVYNSQIDDAAILYQESGV